MENIEEKKIGWIRPPDMLSFNRVPTKTRKEFLEWADEEFSGDDGRGDWGMAFKCVWDYYKGQNRNDKLDHIEDRLIMVESTLSQVISDESNEKEEKVETMLDGITPAN